ncbi:MAG: SDR family NAD(P)-dependent oxidoreductase [Candidatus Coproplasma sp.]
MKKCWLNDKTVIITGGASGIGGGIARLLISKYNCSVIAVIINDVGLEETIASLGDKKDRFTYLYYDVSRYESWTELKKYLEDNAVQVDVLINNAGLFPPFARFETTSKEQLERCLGVDFYSVAYSVQVMYPHISKSATPAFVTVSSSAALAPLAGTSLYTSAKSASKAFTECFSCEHPEIYVGVVCPGFTKTNLFSNQKDDMSKNKLISAFMSDRDKMVKKIVRGIKRKKRRMIFGADAKIMGLLYKLFPKSSPRFFRWIMKISGQKVFEDIFTGNNG